MARERWSPARGGLTSLGLLALGGLLAPASWIVGVLPVRSSEPFNTLTGWVLFSRAALTLVAAAVMLNLAVSYLQAGRTEGKATSGRPQPGRQVDWRAAPAFLLGLLLLLRAAHSLYWLLIWDSTYDALDAFWLPIPIFAVFFAGMFFLASLPGRLKVIGIAFTFAGAIAIGIVYEQAKSVDFRQLTEARAAETAQALERYYERHGHYPETLQQLTPGTILLLPEPVIIFGQRWCYQDGGDAYRLGYVYREHWSDPRLTGRLFRAQGDTSEQPLCTEEIQALRERYPSYPHVHWQGNGS